MQSHVDMITQCMNFVAPVSDTDWALLVTCPYNVLDFFKANIGAGKWLNARAYMSVIRRLVVRPNFVLLAIH